MQVYSCFTFLRDPITGATWAREYLLIQSLVIRQRAGLQVMLAPEANLYPVPDGMSDKVAAQFSVRSLACAATIQRLENVRHDSLVRHAPAKKYAAVHASGMCQTLYVAGSL